MIANPKTVDLIANSTIGGRGRDETHAWNWHRKVKSHFGISTDVIAELWNKIEHDDLIAGRFNHKHLVWTLCHMKVHPAWEGAASKLGCDETTARRWIWEGMELISRADLARENKIVMMSARLCSTDSFVPVCSCRRFVGKTGSCVTTAVSPRCPWMVRTS